MSEQPLLIDTDIFVRMERQPGLYADWFGQQADVATCDAVRAEYLIGVHAPSQAATREKARKFFAEIISAMPSLALDPMDFAEAGRLIGEAIRSGKARPTLGDGLIAACALKSGRAVVTGNARDFNAMGIPNCEPKTPSPPDPRPSAG